MSIYRDILGELLLEEKNVSRLCPEFTSDSRQVVPGSGFAAIPGSAFDGHDFIPAALEVNSGQSRETFFSSRSNSPNMSL